MFINLLLLALFQTADVGTAGKLPAPATAGIERPTVVAVYETQECDGFRCRVVRWEWQRWKKHPNVIYLYRNDGGVATQYGGYWIGAGRVRQFRPFRNGTWGPESVSPVPVPVVN